MAKKLRFLYIEDNPLDRALVRDSLEKEHGGFILLEATSKVEFEQTIQDEPVDLVLTDFNILGYEGLQVLDYVKSHFPEIPVIIVTGTGSEEVAVSAMKRGASDYVIKTHAHIQRLPNTILNVLAAKKLEYEQKQAVEEIKTQHAILNAIMNNSHSIIIFMVDKEYKYLVFNENHRREMIKVYHVDIQVGLNLLDLISISEAKVKAKASIDRVLSGESFVEIQIQPNLNIVYEFHWNTVRKEGKVIGASCFIMDVTERKQAEDELIRRMEELDRFNKVMVGRELKMVDLKKEIDELLERLGEPKKYNTV